MKAGGKKTNNRGSAKTPVHTPPLPFYRFKVCPQMGVHKQRNKAKVLFDLLFVGKFQPAPTNY